MCRLSIHLPVSSKTEIISIKQSYKNVDIQEQYLCRCCKGNTMDVTSEEVTAHPSGKPEFAPEC